MTDRLYGERSSVGGAWGLDSLCFAAPGFRWSRAAYVSLGLQPRASTPGCASVERRPFEVIDVALLHGRRAHKFR